MKTARVKKELASLYKNPPSGCSVWCPNEADLTLLEASIAGPEDTPYSGGMFKLIINIPEQYPFVPPRVHFSTKIYHPNIDVEGRLCLNLLKMSPTGCWKPSHNLFSLLTAIRQLLREPNPNDPLMELLAKEMILQPELFATKAKQWTEKFAMAEVVSPPAAGQKRRSASSLECDSNGKRVKAE